MRRLILSIAMLVASLVLSPAPSTAAIGGVNCVEFRMIGVERACVGLHPHIGERERTGKESFNAWIAFDDQLRSHLAELWIDRREHEFIADALFAIHQQSLVKRRLAFPFGCSRPTTRPRVGRDSRVVRPPSKYEFVGI